MIDQTKLKKVLHYCPETGVFTWLHNGKGRYQRAGAVAGTNKDGYINISVKCRRYRAHRLAWLYMHGTWPPDEIDHINHIKNDNRLANLRLATRAQNCQNLSLRCDNKYGAAGITFHKDRKKCWQAKLKQNGKIKYLGYYATIEEAKTVRRLAENGIQQP